MLPLNKTNWFVKQRQLEQDFVPTPTFVNQVVEEGVNPSKVSKVLYLLKHRQRLTAIEIQNGVNTTDSRKIVSRLRRKHHIETIMERNADNTSSHAVYIYKGEKK